MPRSERIAYVTGKVLLYGYTLTVAGTGVLSLYALAGGKDSVALWPFALAAMPLSSIVVACLPLTPFHAVSPGLSWLLEWVVTAVPAGIQLRLLWTLPQRFHRAFE